MLFNKQLVMVTPTWAQEQSIACSLLVICLRCTQQFPVVIPVPSPLNLSSHLHSTLAPASSCLLQCPVVTWFTAFCPYHFASIFPYVYSVTHFPKGRSAL